MYIVYCTLEGFKNIELVKLCSYFGRKCQFFSFRSHNESALNSQRKMFLGYFYFIKKNSYDRVRMTKKVSHELLNSLRLVRFFRNNILEKYRRLYYFTKKKLSVCQETLFKFDEFLSDGPSGYIMSIRFSSIDPFVTTLLKGRFFVFSQQLFSSFQPLRGSLTLRDIHLTQYNLT